MAPTVLPVTAAETRPLRQAVLRPHQVASELVYPGDDDPRAAHIGVVDGDAVVAVGSVFPEPPPWEGDPDRWRVRGMATTAEWRSKGLGGMVLEALLGHVDSYRGGLVWCNARVPAVPFYERFGFDVQGGPWDEPDIGPHICMVRRR